MLEDGSYDAIVFDATTVDEVIVLELTILSGAHKGEVVAIRSKGLGQDEIALLGMPATIVVEGGEPSVTID